MTPFANKLMKRQLLPLSKRPPYDDSCALVPGGLLKLIDDVHFFDCVQISEMAFELASKMHSQMPFNCKDAHIAPTGMTEAQLRESIDKTPDAISKLFFLPAPNVWLEDTVSTEQTGERFAYLVRSPSILLPRLKIDMTGHDELKGEGCADIFYFTQQEAFAMAAFLPHTGLMCDISMGTYRPEQQRKCGEALAFITGCFLLINSPKIIMREQHTPNKETYKKLSKQFGPGKFPLRAWTTIQLKVSKPPQIDDGEPHEAYLTGKRALHFVRKHIRIRLGQLEYVTSHWRGDPAIGIKRSRYKVTP